MHTGNHSYLLRITVLTTLLWLTGVVSVFSQDYLFDTEIINVEDGLPHRMTYYIVQDKESFIWLSTQGAISRYDGYSFKTYNASFLNIAETSAANLAIDADNRLWYCEENSNTPASGVIDIAKDSIYTMETISNGLFSSKDVIYLGNATTNGDAVLIATRAGVFYKYNGEFEEIYRLPYPVSGLVICKVNPDGSYWILHGKEMIHVKDGKQLKAISAGMFISHIVSTSPQLIVKIYDPLSPIKYRTLENDTLVPYSIPPHAPEDIMGMLQLHEDYICYATKDALIVRNTKGEVLYKFDDFEATWSTNNLITVTSLLDRQQILWVTTQNGLTKLTAKKNPFQTLVPGGSIRGIFKDKETLWVGGNLYRDTLPDAVRLEQEYLDARHNDAISFYKDLQGHLWIGTQRNGVVKYIPDQEKYMYYDHDFNVEKRSLYLPFQNPITKNYWIGTDNGLFRFDPTNKKITPFSLPITSSGVTIRHIYQNKQGIWLASSKGIFLMDAEKETLIKHYTTADGLPVNSILHIHEDNEGIFWLGTKDAGLVRWDISTNAFTQYTTENGLSNNKIYAVYEDDFETLWLPSDYGLMAFDKNTATTRVYLPKDGIAHEEFNLFSHFQDKDDTLYFGGLNGITKFHPAALREKAGATFPLYATRVRVLENDVETFTDRTDAYVASKKISLNPGDRILEVDLTLLDYEKSGANQYAYKLTGKQEQWIYTRDNKLSIINPPYGRYKLEIKARGASGSWSATPLSIPMHVKAPFYLQWWFILGMLLFAIGAIVIAVRWRIQKLEKDRRHLESEVRKRTWQIEQDKKIIEKDKQIIEKQAEDLQALDKAKTRFFANITHEFRTPLTLVTGPVEQIIAEKPPDSIKKRLNSVLKNTRNLMHLINQLLDMSKLEGGRMQVEVSHGDIVRFTKELVHRFQALADTKQLQLNFKAHTAVWKTHLDSDKWTKIVYNLVSNAIKFTPPGGSITLIINQLQQQDQEYIQLNVKDSGIGIAAGSQKHIFNRFFQADASSTRLQGGTGIGLSLVKELTALQNGTVKVESTVGKGTEFTVILPVVPAPETENINPVLVAEDILLPFASEQTEPENEKQTTINNGKFTKENKEKRELLIIEDNAEMRGYIRSCIDASVYNISEAADGEEGIEKAQELVPDLIISDVMMPRKNGFEVTRAIRTHIATSHIPLILLTAKASLESRLEGLERGADAYLTKPFSPKELILRIKNLIELRKLLQQRYQNGENPPEENAGFQKEDHFITELKTYITDRIDEPDLSIEDLSGYFSMSRAQFYRKIKALMNKPIADYIRSIRLEMAAQLLGEQQLNITEVAYATGFSSLSNFSRAFKKVYGKTPSKLR